MSLLSARNAHLVGLVLPFVLTRASKGIQAPKAPGTIEATIRQMENQVSGYALPILLSILISVMVLAGPSGGNQSLRTQRVSSRCRQLAGNTSAKGQDVQLV